MKNISQKKLSVNTLGCSPILSLLKVFVADTCGTLSENVIANTRQHGPQLTRLYAHHFKKIGVQGSQ